MPSFEYFVKDKTGKDLKGVQEAKDAQDLVHQLKSQGYLVIRVEQVKKGASILSVQKASTAKRLQGKNAKLQETIAPRLRN